MKPEKMSPDHLEHTLKNIGNPMTNGAALRAHIAALEQERDAAVADSAALVEHVRTERQMLSMLYHRIKALGLRSEAMTDAVTTVEGWMDAVPDTYEQPHPGATLLEEHRNEIEAWRKATACVSPAQVESRARGLMQHVRDANERIIDMERQHRKALVHARNEGLEKAATESSADEERARRAIAKLNLTTDMGQRRHILLAQRRDLMDALARRIRAMKEPEE